MDPLLHIISRIDIIHLMKLGVVYKEENKKAKEVIGDVRKYLEGKGVEVLGEGSLKKADYILAFGGDGTLIHKASQFADLNIPFIGINTGNVGFLTAVESKDWKEAVEKLVEGGKVFVSERMTLDVAVGFKRAHLGGVPRATSQSHLGGGKHRAVNEAVIKGIYRVAELKISINSEDFLKVLGDGVIVATQTGSTAYSLSAGGSIVDPEIDSLIMTFINPIGLPIPSVVLSPDDEIEVELIKGDDVSLIIDGQEHEKISQSQSVKVKRGEYSVKFGYFDKHQFLKALNAKFGLSSRVAG